MAADPSYDLAFMGPQIGHRLALSISDVVEAAIAGANSATAKTLIELGRIFEHGLAPNERMTAHQRIGRAAQKSVLVSYAATVTRRKRPASQFAYRTTAKNPQNVRFAGGKLRAALAKDDFYEATPNSISIINLDTLDREARHWARLNAGALGIGQGSRRTFDLRWSNLVIAAIGVDMAPSPSFMVPRGYWFDRGEGRAVAPGGPIGAHEFYPVGEGPRGASRVRLRTGSDGKFVPFQPRRRSRGIRANNFLDAGVNRLVRDLPKAYEEMYDDLFKKGIARVRPGRVKVHVTEHRRWR